MDVVKELEFDKEVLKRIEIYDYNLYNDYNITYITKDTSQEKEMIEYLQEKDSQYFLIRSS